MEIEKLKGSSAYIIGSSADLERVERVRDLLAADGVRLTKDWCADIRRRAEHGATDADLDRDAWKRVVDENIFAICAADFVVVLLDTDAVPSLGSWFEIGIATILGRPMFVSMIGKTQQSSSSFGFTSKAVVVVRSTESSQSCDVDLIKEVRESLERYRTNPLDQDSIDIVRGMLVTMSTIQRAAVLRMMTEYERRIAAAGAGDSRSSLAAAQVLQRVEEVVRQMTNKLGEVHFGMSRLGTALANDKLRAAMAKGAAAPSREDPPGDMG